MWRATELIFKYFNEFAGDKMRQRNCQVNDPYSVDNACDYQSFWSSSAERDSVAIWGDYGQGICNHKHA